MSKMQRGLLGRLGCLAWEKTWAIWISETAHVGTLLYGRCLAMKSIIDKGGINRLLLYLSRFLFFIREAKKSSNPHSC